MSLLYGYIIRNGRNNMLNYKKLEKIIHKISNAKWFFISFAFISVFLIFGMFLNHAAYVYSDAERYHPEYKLPDTEIIDTLYTIFIIISKLVFFSVMMFLLQKICKYMTYQSIRKYKIDVIK